MITSTANIEKAKVSFRKVKIYANVFGAGVLMYWIRGPFYLAGSSAGDMLTGVAVIAGVAGFFGTASWIAVLASDLGRRYYLWLIGSLLFGPLGLVVAYIRVRYLAKEHGLG